MVNIEELTGTTENLTPSARCYINRRRYKRVRLYFGTFVRLLICHSASAYVCMSISTSERLDRILLNFV
jgi:hypothetical protein